MDLTSIESADILRELSKTDLGHLGEIAREEEFERGDCLFERGKEATTFYIATRGRFALTVGLRIFDDYSEMGIEELEALDAFGWSSLVEPRTSIYSCYCIEAGAAVTFAREPLETLMATHSDLGERLLHNLNRLIGARVRVMQDHWLDEVSLSMARVQHWTHTELTNRLSAARTEHGTHSPLRWFRRH
jgi:CRP-like cAMP-binding protein